MSSGTKQTQTATATPVIPEDILRVYRQRTAMVEEGMPQFQTLINAGLKGNAEAIQPYLKGFYAPYAKAEQRGIEQLRGKTPRGGAQDLAIAQMLQEGAMKRGEMTSQVLQRLLDYYGTIFSGYSPEKEIGQTQTGRVVTKEPFMLNLGGIASIPIG